VVGVDALHGATSTPAALAFTEVAKRVAAQISIQNMKVLRVIQTA
jgi:hypothetical protein